MDSRYYPNVEADVPKLTVQLRPLFDSEYEVQSFQVSTTSILQARKSNTLRDLTGLSSALTIKVTPETGGTRVEIGMQKWFDKAAVAAVGAIVFLPLNSVKEIGGMRLRKLSRRFLFSSVKYVEGNSSILEVIVFNAAIVEVEL